MAEPATEQQATASTGSTVRRTKVSVVGAGAVGATMAYALLTRGVAREVALFDINRAKVEAEALDLAHGIQFTAQSEVVGSDDVEVVRGSDVVIVTAGAKQKPGQSRLELAESTISLMGKILPSLLEVAPDAIYLMVTNPVDVVTYASLKLTGLPPNRLFGSGTVLDSSRLRYLVAQATGVAVQNVHAYMVGEHGDSEIPLWTSATIGGAPLLDWQGLEGRGPLGDAERAAIAYEVVNSAYRIIEGKGATNYAIALAGSRIVEALLYDQHAVLPVSSLLKDYYGISDVCLSVPSVVGKGGVLHQIEVPLSAAELRGLQASAESIRNTARSFGL
ncbi:L-lactate dehydrogenase [Rarobacter faecitabidus]|uniref:L-lactate dehydrogenase n=1 Tax=Rarobacter faecitabidus TaxID=13243 RepID=A0A542ZWA0_RARFA|nr:L-lactate dehydrogenase [Rarobacter faecitabidus]TQL64637.1 L-lactate dehydrogenase [Rarobacter faecitabidus]